MVAKYFVYKKGGSTDPFVSYEEMPKLFLGQKRKYIGKRQKIETIRRLCNIQLEQCLTSTEVNDYIRINFFKTPDWGKYLKILDEVGEEIEHVRESYTLQYILVVEMSDLVKVGGGNSPEPVNPEDDRIIYLIKNELMGTPIEMYRTLINPIKRLEKDYNSIIL